jgi:predicted component of viral defense system (DUF524 family)
VFAAPLTEQQQSQPPPPPPPAPAQNPQSSAPQASASDAPVAKQRKVWTNDDVVQLRTPADNYLAEKEAREAAKAEAAAKSAAHPKTSGEAPAETPLPTSMEETQLLIKNKEQDISDDQAVLTTLNQELADVPEEQKKAKQKQIEIVAAELDRARNELKALQDHLVALHKQPASESTAAPPPPPPPN